MTLGRVRSPKHRQALVRALQTIRWEAPVPWRVSTLTLYQSVLSSAGPHYTALAELPLGRTSLSTDHSPQTTAS